MLDDCPRPKPGQILMRVRKSNLRKPHFPLALQLRKPYIDYTETGKPKIGDTEMLFRSYTEKKTGMEIVDLGNGQWQDEDGVARAAPGAPALKPLRPAKAPDAPKKAKSPIKAAFKKTATFKRINSVIGHDETLSAAILRFNEEDRYADVLTLSNEDMIAFAAASAEHRAINTNDPQWHVVKAEIITRFGFRL